MPATMYLVQEGFKHVPGLGDCNDACGAGVVDAIMEVINAAGVDNLLPGDVWADQLANACSELCHSSVVLCTAEEPHVCIGKALKDWQCLAIWTHKCTCTCIMRFLKPTNVSIPNLVLASCNS